MTALPGCEPKLEAVVKVEFAMLMACVSEWAHFCCEVAMTYSGHKLYNNKYSGFKSKSLWNAGLMHSWIQCEFTIFFTVSSTKKAGKGKWKSYDGTLRRIVNISNWILDWKESEKLTKGIAIMPVGFPTAVPRLIREEVKKWVITSDTFSSFLHYAQLLSIRDNWAIRKSKRDVHMAYPAGFA